MATASNVLAASTHGSILVLGQLVAPPGRRTQVEEDLDVRGGGRARGDGVDRISGLPDDLLHTILHRVRSTPDAVRTSVLSRRWRRVWAQVPEISFDHDVDRVRSSSILRGIDAVVGAHSAPTLDRIAISVRRNAGDRTPALVAPWLRLASLRLAGGELKIRLGEPRTLYTYDDDGEIIDIPPPELEGPACEGATADGHRAGAPSSPQARPNRQFRGAASPEHRMQPTTSTTAT
nr:unnamed protein product [Digitaria exilis]